MDSYVTNKRLIVQINPELSLQTQITMLKSYFGYTIQRPSCLESFLKVEEKRQDDD